MIKFPQMMVDGNPSSPILVVGECPLHTELSSGAPLTGSAEADLFWSMAKRAGFDRTQCYIVNLIGELGGGKDGEPTKEQLANYSDFFFAALAESKARVALLLGSEAMKATVGLTGILGWRGYLLGPEAWQMVSKPYVIKGVYRTTTKHHRKGDPKITQGVVTVKPPLPECVEYAIATMSPNSVRSGGFKTVPVLAYDVDRAWRAANDELEIFDVEFSGMPADLSSDNHAVCVDIETAWSPGDSGVGGYIERIGVGNEAGVWTALYNAHTKDNAVRELGRHDRVIVGHNLAFDVRRLEDAGIPCVGPLFDTMLACQMLQPDIFKGLNGAASMYLDLKRWKHLSQKEPEFYNAWDVGVTYRLYHILREALEESGVYTHFRDNIMPALRTLIALERDGIKLDRKRVAEVLSEYQRRINEVEKKFATDFPGLSMSSPKQLADYIWGPLAEKYKYKVAAKRNADADVVRRLAQRYPEEPLFGLVLEYRECVEYTKRLQRLQPDIHGVVHPSYAPADKDDEFVEYGGTSMTFAKGIAGTGRIQAKDPNPQQLPKDARDIFIPGRDGNVFIEFDYDSAELRVIAGLSRDAKFMEAVNGPNIHQSHADLWGCTRDDAKTIVYATCYGAGPAKLVLVYSRTARTVSKSWCEDLQNKFFSLYPDYASWRRSIVASLPTQRRLTNAFGRTRYFWDAQRDVPAALDYLPQSTVADIVWSRLPHLSALAKRHDGLMRTIVHDSFLFEVPEENLPQFYKEAKEILEQRFDNVAPGFYLPCKAKAGPNWGALTKYDPASSTASA